jgi:hypothetical protein
MPWFLGHKRREGQRTETPKRDYDANLKRNRDDCVKKEDRDTMNKLEYGWLCDQPDIRHCTEEEKSDDQPDLVEKCSNAKCERARTTSCIRVRLFHRTQEDLLRRLHVRLSKGNGNNTGWYHHITTCRAVAVNFESLKSCPRCRREVELDEVAYYCQVPLPVSEKTGKIGGKRVVP